MILVTPEEFSDDVVGYIDYMMEQYSLGERGPMYLGRHLDRLNLSDEQREKVLGLIRLAIGETTHGIFCALEGSVSLGKSRQKYKLFDEAGNELTGQLDELLYERLEGGDDV